MTTYFFPYPCVGGGYGRIEIDASDPEEAKRRARKMVADGIVRDYEHDPIKHMYATALIEAQILRDLEIIRGEDSDAHPS